MTQLVPAEKIESIVGAGRHQTKHLARAVSAEQTVYILHSAHCLESIPDLTCCAYSIALDRGIDPAQWDGFEDRPVVVTISGSRLMPSGARPHNRTPRVLDPRRDDDRRIGLRLLALAGVDPMTVAYEPFIVHRNHVEIQVLATRRDGSFIFDREQTGVVTKGRIIRNPLPSLARPTADRNLT